VLDKTFITNRGHKRERFRSEFCPVSLQFWRKYSLRHG